jgi:hypothetical protein
MSNIDSKLRYLRVKLRKHGTAICEDVFRRHHPTTEKNKPEICIFCASTSKITKEHVLPKWLFEKDTGVSFVSSVNRQIQTFNKAVIPTCADCNNAILAPIENHVLRIIQDLNGSEYCFVEDLNDIIRWMEILDYKCQIYDCRRKYIKYASSAYDPDWAGFPVAMMRHFIDGNPFKALDYLRSAKRRITIKAKSKRLKSFLIFQTAKPNFDFFTQPNEYIYISLPMTNMAFFFFLRKQFENIKSASKEALHIIKKVSET